VNGLITSLRGDKTGDLLGRVTDPTQRAALQKALAATPEGHMPNVHNDFYAAGGPGTTARGFMSELGKNPRAVDVIVRDINAARAAVPPAAGTPVLPPVTSGDVTAALGGRATANLQANDPHFRASLENYMKPIGKGGNKGGGGNKYDQISIAAAKAIQDAELRAAVTANRDVLSAVPAARARELGARPELGGHYSPKSRTAAAFKGRLPVVAGLGTTGLMALLQHTGAGGARGPVEALAGLQPDALDPFTRLTPRSDPRPAGGVTSLLERARELAAQQGR
jgi:hypothetical protein